MNPWYVPESEKMKIEATKDKDNDSTLFYLIPTGMREVCMQSGIKRLTDVQNFCNFHRRNLLRYGSVELRYGSVELPSTPSYNQGLSDGPPVMVRLDDDCYSYSACLYWKIHWNQPQWKTHLQVMLKLQILQPRTIGDHGHGKPHT